MAAGNIAGGALMIVGASGPKSLRVSIGGGATGDGAEGGGGAVPCGMRAGATATAAEPHVGNGWANETACCGAAGLNEAGADDENMDGDAGGSRAGGGLVTGAAAGDGELTVGRSGAGEKVAGIEAIARGLTNGMTLLTGVFADGRTGRWSCCADIEVAGADIGFADPGPRVPPGGGMVGLPLPAWSLAAPPDVAVGAFAAAAIRGSAGTMRVSTEVTSPTSAGFAIFGRDAI